MVVLVLLSRNYLVTNVIVQSGPGNVPIVKRSLTKCEFIVKFGKNKRDSVWPSYTGCTFKQERFVWLGYTLKSREVCMAWLHVEMAREVCMAWFKRGLYGLVTR